MASEYRRHDVFISYSSKNKNVADAIVADLENHNIKCWYAPRDVLPGDEWAAAIKNAIQQTTVFVLVFTEDSNRSHQVTNEVTLAVNGGKTIIPFRLTDSDMNDTLTYYLSSVHWLDAINPPLTRNIINLREKIASILKIDGQYEAEDDRSAPAPGPASGSGRGDSSRKSGDSSKKPAGGFLIGVLAAVIAACVGGFILFGSRNGKSAQETNIASGETVTGETVAEEPSAEEPAEAAPAVEEAAAAEPVEAETSVEETVAAEPAEAEPVAEEPIEEEPEEPAVNYILPTAVPEEYYFYKGHTYAFYDASRYGFSTYEEVSDFCHEQGGHLAVINDRGENSFLYNLMKENYKITVFFGYTDKDEEGTWVWDGDESNYENWTRSGGWDLPDNGSRWGGGEWVNGGEDYAEFNYDRDTNWGAPNDTTWNDASFMENTSIFFCEWDYDVREAEEMSD